MRAAAASLCVFGVVGSPALAQTVWDADAGTTSYFKAGFDDWLSPSNQDAITDAVVLTRASTSGLFNIAQEAGYSPSSPAGTRWAFSGVNNADFLFGEGAQNFAMLSFDNWQASLGGSGGSIRDNILDRPGVLHLISEDIYIDIRFTDWAGGNNGGGEVGYVRAVPAPASAGVLALGGLAVRRRRVSG